jgi:CBS domain-containing protein
MTTSPINAARSLLRDACRVPLRGRSIGFGFLTAISAESSSLPSQSTAAARDISSFIDRRHSHSISTTHPTRHHRSRSHYCYRQCQFSSVAHVEDASDKQSSPLPLSARVAESSNFNSDSNSTTANNNDGNEQEEPRQRISDVKISEVLKRKHTLRWVEPVISKDATVREAITVCIERKLNGMMVVDRSNKVVTNTTTTLDSMKQKCVGLITSRDILRMMASSIKEGKSSEDILNQQIYNQMTPINQVIYGRPDETIGMCRAIMAKLGIKCLPILAEGRVEGILTSRDMADFYFNPKDRGGKQNYLRDISERVGLTSDTSMAEPPVFVRQHLALKHAPLYLNVGVEEYPHPFKTADGIGSNRRGE